ncbi:glycosyltransferase family 1 protein [Marinobacteraceae bacterium S3BR75-40.1]
MGQHIAIVTETFPPEINGVANTLRHICQGLKHRGHRVSVVRPRQQQEAQIAIREPLLAKCDQTVVTGLPLPGYPDLRFGLPAGSRLRRLWQSDRPDALYIATEGPLGWSAQATARKLRIPVCSGFHTNFQTYSQFYNAGFLERIITAYLRAFHNRTGRTLVPTDLMRRRLQSIGISNARVWSRGVDCDLFSPDKRCDQLRRQWGLSAGDRAVLYVGRLAPEKNLWQAVNTFERIRRIHPRSRFILVGDGPLRRRLSERHPDYLFCGMQQGEALAQHFASGDLFLFPSKTDTFGNVVTEALASGLGVVAFDDAAASEHIQHKVNGMKVDLADDESFTASALQMLDQPSLLRQIRLAARRKALSLHWDTLIEAFENWVLTTSPKEPRHAIKQSYPIV